MFKREDSRNGFSSDMLGVATDQETEIRDGFFLRQDEIAEIFDIPADELPKACRKYLSECDLNFRVLQGHEREQVILEVLRSLQEPLGVSGPERKPRWESGWSENRDAFITSGFDLTELLPKYYKPWEIIRLNGNYLLPLVKDFEVQFFTILRLWLFKTYMESVSQVYEFGCGTGHNLAILGELFPQKKLVGLDWAQASQETLGLLNEKLGLHVKGKFFDMFSPDQSLSLAPNSGVLTMGSLEQLGSSFMPFLEFLLQKKPSICVHVEPIYELYNQSTLFDYVGASYHLKRGYFTGFLPALQELEAKGVIRILKIRKTLGSMASDGYSVVVWTPIS